MNDFVVAIWVAYIMYRHVFDIMRQVNAKTMINFDLNTTYCIICGDCLTDALQMSADIETRTRNGHTADICAKHETDIENTNAL